jgi:hypothetical protein
MLHWKYINIPDNEISEFIKRIVDYATDDKPFDTTFIYCFADFGKSDKKKKTRKIMNENNVIMVNHPSGEEIDMNDFLIRYSFNLGISDTITMLMPEEFIKEISEQIDKSKTLKFLHVNKPFSAKSEHFSVIYDKVKKPAVRSENKFAFLDLQNISCQMGQIPNFFSNLVKRFGKITTMFVFLEEMMVPEKAKLIKSLNSAGCPIQLVSTEKGKAETVDAKIKSVLIDVVNSVGLCEIIMISGDSDFSNDLAKLAQKGYAIHLIHNNIKDTFKNNAHWTSSTDRGCFITKKKELPLQKNVNRDNINRPLCKRFNRGIPHDVVCNFKHQCQICGSKEHGCFECPDFKKPLVGEKVANLHKDKLCSNYKVDNCRSENCTYLHPNCRECGVGNIHPSKTLACPKFRERFLKNREEKEEEFYCGMCDIKYKCKRSYDDHNVSKRHMMHDELSKMNCKNPDHLFEEYCKLKEVIFKKNDKKEKDVVVNEKKTRMIKTKPCAYFQSRACMSKRSECRFAHVCSICHSNNHCEKECLYPNKLLFTEEEQTKIDKMNDIQKELLMQMTIEEQKAMLAS